MATVPLGLARAALDDVVELATDKVPLLSPSPLATNPLFQYQLADAEVTLRVSRALLYEAAGEAWAAAVAGDEFTPASAGTPSLNRGAGDHHRRVGRRHLVSRVEAGARSTSRARFSVGCAMSTL